jgi:hypothetical protein
MKGTRLVIVTAVALLAAGVLAVSVALASHTGAGGTIEATQVWSDSGVHLLLRQQQHDTGMRLMVLAPASYLGSDTSTDWSDSGAHLLLSQRPTNSVTHLMVLAPASYLNSDTSTDWNDAGAARHSPYRADIWSDAGATRR